MEDLEQSVSAPDHLPAHLTPALASAAKMHLIDPKGSSPDTASLGAFLGTAFCVGKSRSFITAAHCVPEDPSQIVIVGASRGRTSACFVREIARHTVADIAILRTYDGQHCDPQPFGRLGEIEFAGEDFWAFGFPTDVFGENPSKPTPRIFRGYAQRFVDYKSPLGYQYRAIEMSVACPPGLSGGPLFRTHPVVEPFGVVAENLETVSLLHSEVEQSSERGRSVERFQTVINYGIAVDLSTVGS